MTELYFYPGGPPVKFEYIDYKDFTMEFRGPCKLNGEVHNVSMSWCEKCKVIIRIIHYGCCGFQASGFTMSGPHKCKDENNKS